MGRVTRHTFAVGLKLQLQILRRGGAAVVAPLAPSVEPAWPACASCHGREDVRWQDELGDLAFCGECLEGARTPAPAAELGGEC
jgi:hypothetical protein